MNIPGMGTIDINTAGLSVLVWVIVLSIIFFFIRMYWPWYTKERWPRLQAQKEQEIAGTIEIEKTRNQALSGINENLVRLTTLTQANFHMLEAHDSWTREWSLEVTPSIRDIKDGV